MELKVNKIEKPWGYELLWAKTENYMGKYIHINAGYKTSKKYHQVKEETFYVLKGILYSYDANGSITRVLPGGHIHVKPHQIHQFGANETSVTLIEVSTPQLYDVIRIEDDYNRVKTEEDELEELYRIYGGD